MTTEHPFPQVAKPVTPLDFQRNANHWYFELMKAEDELNAYGYGKAPADVFAAAHTCRWVYKEKKRLADKARQTARAQVQS